MENEEKDEIKAPGAGSSSAKESRAPKKVAVSKRYPAGKYRLSDKVKFLANDKSRSLEAGRTYILHRLHADRLAKKEFGKIV